MYGETFSSDNGASPSKHNSLIRIGTCTSVGVSLVCMVKCLVRTKASFPQNTMRNTELNTTLQGARSDLNDVV